MKTYRQGDLYIKEVDALPKGMKRIVDNVVLRGEVTGHAHRLQSGELWGKNGAMFMNIPISAFLVHEEHKPIKLPKGKFAVIRQREYLTKDMTKVVAD